MYEAQTALREKAALTNLRRLFLLRNIAIAGQSAAVAVAVAALHLQLPLKGIAWVTGGLALFNALTFARLRWVSHAVGVVEFFVQLLVDVLALGGVLYFTGGATNPFVLLFLLPLTIAATVLPAAYTWSLAATSIACYTLLMWDYVPLPYSHAEGNAFSMHVFGMWLGFVLGAALVAYFVVNMGRALRRQEQALAEAREQQLRDQQLVALGTLAASTAHELGTPLGTMALLAEELRETGVSDEAAWQAGLQTLQDQIERCKQALSVLTASGGNAAAVEGGAMTVDRFLERLREQWQGSRPHVSLRSEWSGIQPPPAILAERTLMHAIKNILDNAADASPDEVEWHAVWDDEQISMEINDHGPGLGEHARQRIGLQPYSGKSGGLGLGLFLAHATIGRLGGQVTLSNRPKGGVCTRVLLPLAGLSVGSAA